MLCRAVLPQINMPRPEPVREPSPPPGPKDEDFIDPDMAVRSGPGRGRSRGGAFLAPGRGRGKKGALEFVEEGSLQRQAEIMRLKQKYGECGVGVWCVWAGGGGGGRQSKHACVSEGGIDRGETGESGVILCT
jgi:hypothetical protein